ncbi:TatD DNase domain containing 3 [Cricetulus griseus]
MPRGLPVGKPAEMAVGAVGLGLVDCHCHLSAPEFNSVCEAESGAPGVGRAASFPGSYPLSRRSSGPSGSVRSRPASLRTPVVVLPVPPDVSWRHTVVATVLPLLRCADPGQPSAEAPGEGQTRSTRGGACASGQTRSLPAASGRLEVEERRSLFLRRRRLRSECAFDLDEVLEKAKKAHVTALVAVAEHAGEFERIMQLSERYTGFILPCLGVHPVQELSPEEPRSVTLKDLDVALPIIEKYKDRLLAIGEVGLDFSPRFAGTEEQKEEQRQVLIRQVQLAKRLNVPL